MTVTREDLIRMLSVESGYTMQDIRHLLHCMDDVIINELYSVTPDEEIAVQLMQGVKIICVQLHRESAKTLVIKMISCVLRPVKSRREFHRI